MARRWWHTQAPVCSLVTGSLLLVEPQEAGQDARALRVVPVAALQAPTSCSHRHVQALCVEGLSHRYMCVDAWGQMPDG